MLSRVIAGSRVSLIVGLLAVIIACVIGTTLGMIAGYFGGIVDDIINRTSEAVRVIPQIVFAIALCAVFGGGILNLAIVLGISNTTVYIRMMRSQVLSIKERDYIMAGKLQGNSNFRLMFHHILPNSISPIIVTMTQQVGNTILSEAGLSFLGLGISKPTATWGALVNGGRSFLLTNPIYSLAPGIAIALLVICLNTLGDGVRDALYLTALVPAYATVLLASGKGFSASGFYMLAFVLIYVVEWLIKLVLIPGIHLFLVLEVLNHVSSEKKLEKLAEFIESAVTKIMKASIKIVAGIGIVQAMIAPAKDKISESLILKSFQAIPGVGRLGQGAGEIMLGCAMLIKNSVGMAAIIVLFFIVLTPLVKTLIFSLMYRLLSAALQPVSDNRIVEGIEAVARAGNMYYIVIRDASILFFIVIAIVCASTSFMGG